MASGNQIRLRVAGNRLKAARQRAFVGRSGAAGGAHSYTRATKELNNTFRINDVGF